MCHMSPLQAYIFLPTYNVFSNSFCIMKNVYQAPWCGASKELWCVCKMTGSFPRYHQYILGVMFTNFSCMLMQKYAYSTI